jgi:D-alanine transaminase
VAYNTFLNGDFIDISQATVSVLDRGFLFGDSIYEVFPIFNGTTFGTQEHLERLNNSLNAIHLKNPLSGLQLGRIFQELLRETNVETGVIYLQITRGAPAVRSYRVPQQSPPTVLITVMPAPEQTNNTLTAVTLDDQRWQQCHIKTTTLLPNVLAKYTAEQEEADEAIYIRDGYALEGTSSNLFIVIKGSVVTPPLTQNILPGITRKFLLQVLRDQNIPHIEREIKKKELLKADEIWLASSSRDFTPVTILNNKPVGTGKAGPLYEAAYEAFQAFKIDACTEVTADTNELVS